MASIIKFIGTLLALSGAGIVWWYEKLSDDKKQKYDETVFRILSQKMMDRYGIMIDSSDTLKSIGEKAQEKGVSQEEFKRVLTEFTDKEPTDEADYI